MGVKAKSLNFISFHLFLKQVLMVRSCGYSLLVLKLYSEYKRQIDKMLDDRLLRRSFQTIAFIFV